MCRLLYTKHVNLGLVNKISWWVGKSNYLASDIWSLLNLTMNENFKDEPTSTSSFSPP